MSDKKRENIVTGVVELAYCKISKPDTYGEKADGKFKTLVKISGSADGAALKKVITDKAAELLPKTKKPKLPFWTNDEGVEFLRASSKYRPLVQDAKGNDIAPKSVEGLQIGGGTQARLRLGLNPFDGRLSLYLNAVQIVKLEQYESRGSGFGAMEGVEDGFTFSDTTTETKEGEPASEAEDGDDPYNM